MPIQKHYYQCLYSNPIVELSGYESRHGLAGKLYAYLDFGGATGTAKDGLAEGMLALAAQKGKLEFRSAGRRVLGPAPLPPR